VGRIHADKGYRGHNYPDRFKVWISGQARRVTQVIRREMRRRAPVEPVIGHLKDDHRMRRNHLKGRQGDRINAVLAAAGYNFSLLLRWFRRLLRALLLILARAVLAPASPKIALGSILHGRLYRLTDCLRAPLRIARSHSFPMRCPIVQVDDDQYNPDCRRLPLDKRYESLVVFRG
jgi:DDE family transposase